jgi:hypothetical protein
MKLALFLKRPAVASVALPVTTAPFRGGYCEPELNFIGPDGLRHYC